MQERIFVRAHTTPSVRIQCTAPPQRGVVHAAGGATNVPSARWLRLTRAVTRQQRGRRLCQRREHHLTLRGRRCVPSQQRRRGWGRGALKVVT